MSEVYLENITVSYGDLKALDNFSMKIENGSFISLLGPSGCGKTTCLRTVAGFIRPDVGNVYIGGEKVNDLPPNKRKIGIVFQNYALFPHKTVFNNVAFGLRMKKTNKLDIKERVYEMLCMLHLSDFENRYPNQLSGGQQQRVALARALVTKPSVLLLDEPLGALDKKLREEMQIELRAIQKRLGITTIFVTHDQEEALTMSDIITIINEGQTEQLGKPEDIYNKPQNRFVADFIGLSNFLSLVIKKKDRHKMICKLGDITISVPDAEYKNCIVGDKIEIAIRPEKIGMSSEFDHIPGSNWVSGIIKNIVYKGCFTLYYLEVEKSYHITVQRISSNDASDVFKLNQNVYLNWLQKDTFVLGSSD